jgi:hypothetical protein
VMPTASHLISSHPIHYAAVFMPSHRADVIISSHTIVLTSSASPSSPSSRARSPRSAASRGYRASYCHRRVMQQLLRGRTVELKF